MTINGRTATIDPKQAVATIKPDDNGGIRIEINDTSHSDFWLHLRISKEELALAQVIHEEDE